MKIRLTLLILWEGLGILGVCRLFCKNRSIFFSIHDLLLELQTSVSSVSVDISKDLSLKFRMSKLNSLFSGFLHCICSYVFKLSFSINRITIHQSSSYRHYNLTETTFSLTQSVSSLVLFASKKKLLTSVSSFPQNS